MEPLYALASRTLIVIYDAAEFSDRTGSDFSVLLQGSVVEGGVLLTKTV